MSVRVRARGVSAAAAGLRGGRPSAHESNGELVLPLDLGLGIGLGLGLGLANPNPYPNPNPNPNPNLPLELARPPRRGVRPAIGWAAHP